MGKPTIRVAVAASVILVALLVTTFYVSRLKRRVSEGREMVGHAPSFAVAHPPSLLVTDLPFEPPANGTFDFQVWLNPEAQKNKKVHVFLYDNPSLTYTPKEFDLDGSKPASIHVEKSKSVSLSASLVEVIAEADNDVGGIDQTINFGFKAALKADIPTQLRGGETRSFTIKLVDDQGKPVALKAPAQIRLVGSNVRLNVSGQPAASPLVIPLQTGANASPLIEIVPEEITGGPPGPYKLNCPRVTSMLSRPPTPTNSQSLWLSGSNFYLRYSAD